MGGVGIYLFNFIPLLIICLVFVWIGRPFSKNQHLTFREVFFSIFINTLILSTAFAIGITGGKTVMIGFLLLAIIYSIKFPFSKTKINHPGPSKVFLISSLLFGGLFVFSWSFFSLVQFDSFPYHIPPGTAMAPNDYLINVVRSYYLGVGGEENYYHVYNTLDPAYHGPKPYHYLEMWTTYAFNYFLGSFTAEKFALMTTPLYHLIAFTGILALWERYQTLKWYHVLLSASFFFVAGIHLPFYYQLGVLDFSLPMFTHRMKMCVYYPFILACLIAFDKDKPQVSIIMLSGLMLATIVVAPAVLGGGFLFLGYLFFKSGNKRQVLESVGILLVTTLFIFLFYKFLESGQFNIRANAGSNSLTSGLLGKLLDSPFQKVVQGVLILLKESASYLPLLFVGLFLVWKEKGFFTRNTPLFVLVSGIMISGAGAYVLFTGEKDATQLFFNIGNALMNCCLIWGVIRCLSVKEEGKQLTWYHGMVGLLLIFIFVKQIPQAYRKNIKPVYTKAYSDEYLSKIKAFVQTDDQITIGAAIKGGTDYRSAFSKQTAAYTLGYYLAFMEDGALALQISDYDIHKPTVSAQQARSSNLFYRFVQQQKTNDSFVSIGASQAAFIKKYKLDFVVISKNGLLRDEVKNLVNDSFVDPVSGERFLILK